MGSRDNHAWDDSNGCAGGTGTAWSLTTREKSHYHYAYLQKWHMPGLCRTQSAKGALVRT